MQIQKFNSDVDRLVLTGMIVDSTVCGEIASKWSEGLFPVPWCNLIASWCTDYYKEYGKAPMNHIEHLFREWGENNADKETVRMVEKFLGSLSGQYVRQKKQLNPQLVLDKAGAFFNKHKLLRHAEDLKLLAETNKITKGLKKATEYEPVKMGKGSAVSLFRNMEAINRAFVERSESLIQYPGALGNFFGDAFCRDSFIGFQGREKSGKTFWLMDVAYKAALQRKKVLFFQIGDLSESQMLMRFATRAAVQVANKRDELVKWPTGLTRGTDGPNSYNLTYKERKMKVITPQAAKDALTKICKEKIRTVKDDYLMVETYPNDSVGIIDIRSIVMQYVKREWVPDFIIIDYADLLIPPPGMLEGRDAINKNWKGMKRISQELHCCLVTATQSDAGSYNQTLMDMSNFSEDKRKYSHVTAMVSINRTDDEVQDQVARLSFLVRRESKYSLKAVAFAAGCYEVSNPCIQYC